MAHPRTSAPPVGQRPAPSARPTPARGVGAPLALAAGLAASAGVVFLADPEGRHVPLCPFRAVTGLDCPLCGGLRAVQDLVRGDLVAAADHNLLFVASLPLLATWWGVWLERSRRGDGASVHPPTWWPTAALAVGLVFTVVRNLPAWSWLAST